MMVSGPPPVALVRARLLGEFTPARASSPATPLFALGPMPISPSACHSLWRCPQASASHRGQKLGHLSFKCQSPARLQGSSAKYSRVTLGIPDSLQISENHPENTDTGDIVYADVLGQPLVVLNSAKIAKELLDQRSAIHSDRPNLVMANLRLGAIIIRVTFGHYITGEQDPFLTSPVIAMENFSKATLPGAWVVDFLPILQYLPEWTPGASFLRTTKKWYKITWDTTWVPYFWSKKNLVRFQNSGIYGTGVRHSSPSEYVLYGAGGQQSSVTRRRGPFGLGCIHCNGCGTRHGRRPIP
ncbi:hypothetical protein DFH09DRAFT_1106944 [Mycena vulgaris]|nr:hypothetical protein DFH09DRAFT_1106944 [Mycena vulgaris]